MSADPLIAPANEGEPIVTPHGRVRCYREGIDGPAAVIVTGAGDCADSWLPIRNRLATSCRVVGYDRAGIGGSETGAPATMERYLDELDAVVDATSARDPAILVGHSLGGLIARLFQQAHPGRVGGLVLLDSTPEAVADDRGGQAGFIASSIAARVLKVLTPLGFTRLLLRSRRFPLYPEQARFGATVSPAQYDRWMAMACSSFGRGAGAELRSVIAVAAQAKAVLAGHLIEVPLTVVASTAFGDTWVDWQRGIATLSATSSFTLTGTRSHNIHLRHPELVTAAVEDIARLAKA